MVDKEYEGGVLALLLCRKDGTDEEKDEKCRKDTIFHLNSINIIFGTGIFINSAISSWKNNDQVHLKCLKWLNIAKSRHFDKYVIYWTKISWQLTIRFHLQPWRVWRFTLWSLFFQEILMWKFWFWFRRYRRVRYSCTNRIREFCLPIWFHYYRRAKFILWPCFAGT